MPAKPFADVPKVAITSGPGNYGPAAGTISISGLAGLAESPAHIATGISSLGLLVDGLVSSAAACWPGLVVGRGTFSLDTAGLSDGVHEVRLVAINNSQAASEGYVAQPIVVNNHGHSINFNGGNPTLTSSATTFSLAATAGDGTLSTRETELTCLAAWWRRPAARAGSLSLSPTALAAGDNVIVPVLVFSALDPGCRRGVCRSRGKRPGQQLERRRGQHGAVEQHRELDFGRASAERRQRRPLQRAPPAAAR